MAGIVVPSGNYYNVPREYGTPVVVTRPAGNYYASPTEYATPASATAQQAVLDAATAATAAATAAANAAITAANSATTAASTASRVASSGLGTIQYFTQDPPMVLQANQPVVFTATVDPTQTNDALNAPFVGHAFWDGTHILPRSMNDFYDFQLNLVVESMQVGGRIASDVDVGSPNGPVGTDSADLFRGAGVQERVSLHLNAQVKTNFLRNGAIFHLTPTVALTIVSRSILVLPHAVFVGAGQ